MREMIKSASGKTLGYKFDTGNVVLLQDASGKSIGRFDKNTNKTFDKTGRAVYEGDQTSALLESE